MKDGQVIKQSVNNKTFFFLPQDKDQGETLIQLPVEGIKQVSF